MGGDELAALRGQRAYLLADGRVQRLQLGDVGRGVAAQGMPAKLDAIPPPGR